MQDKKSNFRLQIRDIPRIRLTQLSMYIEYKPHQMQSRKFQPWLGPACKKGCQILNRCSMRGIAMPWSLLDVSGTLVQMIYNEVKRFILVLLDVTSKLVDTGRMLRHFQLSQLELVLVQNT